MAEQGCGLYSGILRACSGPDVDGGRECDEAECDADSTADAPGNRLSDYIYPREQISDTFSFGYSTDGMREYARI